VPFSPYGKVRVNGANVPTDVLIAAWCDGVKYAQTEPETYEAESWYALDVPGEDDEEPGKDGCYVGETVTFTIDGLDADQSAPWASGQSYQLDLTAFRPVPDIGIEKRTNGADAGSAPGPFIEVGEPVTWTYLVSNTGNVTLTAVTVTDDQLGSISCPTGTLGVNQSVVCTATGAALAGQYINLGTASGAFTDVVVADNDPSCYFGASPAVGLETHTNGEDADSAPGPYIVVGQPVIWTFHIINDGNVTLTGVTVTDDRLGSVSCPTDTLRANQQMTCAASGEAAGGPYSNRGTVFGHWGGIVVSASDPSHYTGVYATYLPLAVRD
jgi:uncharacterized repeat protein (TIGR01451 family)